MNIFLFRTIINWVSTICLSVLSLLGSSIYENTTTVSNNTINKSTTIVSNVVEYKTIKKYNSKLPSNKTNVLVEGKEGLSYLEDGKEKIIRAAVDEVIEVGTGRNGEYNGHTTGYGPDCIGCSGNVACKTREGTTFNLNTNGIYYDDIQFGSVRVVAADHRIFPCGTVIEIDNGNQEPFLAIVMDTGSGMLNNWNKYRLVHIDIAYETQQDESIYNATSKNAEFSVQRWGW